MTKLAPENVVGSNACRKNQHQATGGQRDALRVWVLRRRAAAGAAGIVLVPSARANVISIPEQYERANILQEMIDEGG